MNDNLPYLSSLPTNRSLSFVKINEAIADFQTFRIQKVQVVIDRDR